MSSGNTHELAEGNDEKMITGKSKAAKSSPCNID